MKTAELARYSIVIHLGVFPSLDFRDNNYNPVRIESASRPPK